MEDSSQAALKLKQHLANFLPLIEHSSDLITIVNAEGVMVYASPAHEDVLGYAPEELVGTPFLDYAHPDDVAKARSVMERTETTPSEAPSFEIRVKHKDGSYRWLLTTVTNQLDHPILKGMVVNCRHITERKDTQAALSWESDLNSAITELAQALISSVSLQSISRMVLKEAQKLTGSAFGFVGYIVPETGNMVIAAMTAEVWEKCHIDDPSVAFESFEGLWGWSLKHQRPLISNDVEEDARSSGLPEGHMPIRRFLAAPALIGHTLMGQVALANPDRPYNGLDLAVVKRFASLYAIAVEAQRSRDALSRYAEEQAALYTIGAAIASLRTPEAVTDTVIEAVLSTLEADAGWINVPAAGDTDEEGDVAVSVAGYGIPADMKQTMVSGGICPILASIEYDESADNVMAMCEHMPSQLIQEGTGHWVCIPIVVAGRLIGSLSLLWEDPGPLASNHSLLRAIGRQIGVALENARLYREAQQVDQLRVLNALDQALQATLNPKELARVTLEHVTRALDTSGGTFLSCQSQDSLCFNTQLSDDRVWQIQTLSERERGQIQRLVAWLQNRGEASPVLIKDLFQEGRAEITPSIQGWTVDDMLAPLTSDHGIGGVLVLRARGDGRPFTSEDRALARAVANRASQMLLNAQLYQASREQTDRLRTLNRISSFAAGSLDPDTILDRILALTGRAFDVEEGSVLLRVTNGEDQSNDGSQSEGEKIVFKAALEHKGLVGRHIQLDQGIAGWVVHRNQSVVVNEVERDRRFYSGVDAVTDFKTRSILCVPLRVHNEAIGAIEMINKRDGAFTQDDRDLLEAVAAIASVALDNARLYTRTRDRAEELSALNAFSRELASTLDSERLIKAALDQITERFRADSVALMQEEEKPEAEGGAEASHARTLHFVQGHFQGAYQRSSLRIPVGDSLTGRVYAEQEPMLIADVQVDPQFFVEANDQLTPHPHAMMAVPLIIQDQVIGVLVVASQESSLYDEEDLQTLQAFASTFAVALENARLYEDLRVLLRERERTQAMMIHTEKMAALGRLVASLAHEINNPLQAVLGCLTLAREELDEASVPIVGDGEVSSYIDIAEGEIDRISEIVHRMRDFYRPTRGGMRRTDVHEILEKVLDLSTSQLERNNVVVHRDWEPDLPEIHATSDHLMQVFLNLLLNAVDAMPEGGTLTIRTRRQREGAELPGVRIEFEDTGVGMEPEVLSRIFEPFFTTKPKGSGLGLSISYSIIQAHEGEIRVASRPGQGTTFTLLLPSGDIKEHPLP
jgi:PAS domain S-box-containing protein